VGWSIAELRGTVGPLRVSENLALKCSRSQLAPELDNLAAGPAEPANGGDFGTCVFPFETRLLLDLLTKLPKPSISDRHVQMRILFMYLHPKLPSRPSAGECEASLLNVWVGALFTHSARLSCCHSSRLSSTAMSAEEITAFPDYHADPEKRILFLSIRNYMVRLFGLCTSLSRFRSLLLP
jgi:hypothetical protein